MFRSAPLTLFASALLLATAGCSLEKVDRAQSMPPSTSAIAEPAAGHELHVMFEAEKRSAAVSELPAQF